MTSSILVAVAVVPLCIVFLGLAWFRKPGKYVGPLGWLVAIVLAATFFHAPLDELGTVSLSGIVWTFAIFVWNIIGAFFFLGFLKDSGLLELVKEAFAGSSSDTNVQLLLIGFSFALFLGSVAPGGSNFAITSLILTTFGVDPLLAAVVGLFGNGVQSPYGLLGVGMYALSRVTGLSLRALSSTVGIMMIAFAALTPLWMLILLKGRNTRDSMPEALVIGSIYSVVNVVVATLLGPELPNLLAGGSSVLFGVLFSTFRGNESHRPKGWSIFPFLLMTALILTTRLIAPLKAILNAPVFTLVFDLPSSDAVTFPFMYSPGTLMCVTTLLCARLYGFGREKVRRVFVHTVRQAVPVLIAVSSFVAMAEVMRNFGMTTVMAEAMATVAGGFYPFIAPAIGALGCAITGSTTASNIFFGRFQVEVAGRLGLSEVVISSSQTIGCMAGEMVSPLNAIVVTTPLGMKGMEGEVIRRNVLSSLMYLLMAAMLSYAFIQHG